MVISIRLFQMEIDSCYLFDEEYSNLMSSTIMEDSIDEYLEDPTLNVFDMIEKVIKLIFQLYLFLIFGYFVILV
jgi:hypothetical protein